MSAHIFVASHAIAMEGAVYTVNVYRYPAGYLASWECGKCGQQYSLPAAADRDAAFRQCEPQIRRHHGKSHAPAAKV